MEDDNFDVIVNEKLSIAAILIVVLYLSACVGIAEEKKEKRRKK